MVNIAGLNKAAVLAALHNGTKALGMGRLRDLGMDMTIVEAEAIIGGDFFDFDYVNGRPLKVDISGDEFNERLYDRDAGAGRAAEVIAALREGQKPSPFSMPDEERGR
jgi:hypothetical protein